MRAVHILGLDLGQANDPTALIVLERPVWIPEAALDANDFPQSGWCPPGMLRPDQLRRVADRTPPTPPDLHLRALHRYPLQTPYPAIVEDVVRRMQMLPHPDATALVIDWTGCGRPVFDMFARAGLSPIGISIHGGETVVVVDGGYRVPKRDLVGAVQSALQSRRLKFAAGIGELDVLTAELKNFRIKIDPETAHDSYSAWREHDHDDTVLATAIATWWAGLAPASHGFCHIYDTRRV